MSDYCQYEPPSIEKLIDFRIGQPDETTLDLDLLKSSIKIGLSVLISMY